MHIILVHGIWSRPGHHFFPWLRKEMEKRGHRVTSARFPNPAYPDRFAWVTELGRLVEDPADTIIVAHSLGTFTTLRYLNDVHSGAPFAHIILVSGFGRDFVSKHIERILPPISRLANWFDVPPDFDHVRPMAHQWTCIHSTNDPLVPYTEGVWLAEQLHVPLVTEHRGHFTTWRLVWRLPSALEAVLKTKNLIQ